MSEKVPFNYTLCWDCKKASGGCNWSDSLNPVEGWTANPISRRIHTGQILESYVIIDCPEFKRDAYRGGLVRYKETNTNESM